MAVKIHKVKAEKPDARVIAQAVKLLNRGEVVVCPTDTGYAFAANALDNRAITRVFHLKGRSFNNPVHIAVTGIDEADKYGYVNEEARFLAGRYLPGGLTLVMKKREIIPPRLVAETDTIGIRIPDNRVMLELAAAAGYPLTTTSANISGMPGTYSIPEIQEQLGERINEIAMILDAGTITSREVSTIIDVTARPAQLIRQGVLSWLEIKDELRRFEIPKEPEEG